MITAEGLSQIRVLFRAGNLSLYGIPDQMRPGQQPRDLWRANQAGHRTDGPRDDWLWLGSPGWWGRLAEEEQALVRAWLDERKDHIPHGCWEWCLNED